MHEHMYLSENGNVYTRCLARDFARIYCKIVELDV